MSPKDFEGLTIPKFKNKLKDVKNLSLLDELKAIEEKSEKPRNGVFDAIQERRTEIVETVESAPEEKKDSAPDATPEKSENQPDPSKESLSDNKKEENDIKSENENSQSSDEDKSKDSSSDSKPKKWTKEEVDAMEVEEIQDLTLEDFEPVVSLIDDQAKLHKIREAEFSDDHRKGAYEILDNRLQELQPKRDLVKEIREHRLRLDFLSKCCYQHLKISNSQVTDHLWLAKCWLGKLLGSLNAENPYAGESQIKTTADIPATADAVQPGTEEDVQVKKYGLKNLLPAVIEMREALEEEAKFIDSIYLERDHGREAAICRTEAWKEVRIAKFYLGDVLSQIRTK